MSQPSVRDEIEVVETKINAGLKQDPSGQSWQLQLDGAQWGIVLEALQATKLNLALSMRAQSPRR
jgi:hypothetical protein